ncbi:hypothetical protein BJ741DRAFT_713476 [Chytriomyces cf. hyalinus JEL632]|nr:hypothetical protein BJ741DRAFT_713476 [Chytriomyces cf. hyalinus JEL632]
MPNSIHSNAVVPVSDSPPDIATIFHSATVVDANGDVVRFEELPRVLLLYFGAAWSPASSRFHPLLTQAVRQSIHTDEAAVLYVSADRTEQAFRSMLSNTGFYSFQYPLPMPLVKHFRAVRASLEISSLPNVLVFDTQKNQLITLDGARHIERFGSAAVRNWVQPHYWWTLAWIWSAAGRALFLHSLLQVAILMSRPVVRTISTSPNHPRQPFQPPGSLAKSLRPFILPGATNAPFNHVSSILFMGHRLPLTRTATDSRLAPATAASTSQAADTLFEQMPPTLTSSQMNADDNESIFHDRASIFSNSSATTTHERLIFPSPSEVALVMPTPPSSPVPILKKSGGSSSSNHNGSPNNNNNDTGLSSSVLSLSALSMDASLVNLNESILSMDFRGNRRDSAFSTISPDVSFMLSDSLMSEFRRRKVSFSQTADGDAIDGDESGVSRHARRESLSGSMVVIERGVWDVSEEDE